MSTNSITLRPVGPLDAEITPPGSKSITNRALAIAGVANGVSVLEGALDCEDTQMMMNALRVLGVEVVHSPEDARIRVAGSGGKLPKLRADEVMHVALAAPAGYSIAQQTASHFYLECGNSGTTLRFLTAMCAVGEGTFTLDGVPRMRQRPVGDLVSGLRQLGARVECPTLKTPCPPVTVYANGLRGGTAKISGSISSQFLSGILMAAVHAKEETRIQVLGDLVSRPYIDMTISVMRAFGGSVRPVTPTAEHVTAEFLLAPGQRYRAAHYVIEPDASAASYFFAAAAVVGGRVKVRNLSKNALQGDVRFCECLAKMGCGVEYLPNGIVVSRNPESPLHGVEADMHDISDTARTLAVTALFADSPTRIRNVANMRLKETDRIRAVCTELRKFGAVVEEFEDGMTIHPLSADSLKNWEKNVEIETYNDHRMAMSFAAAGLRLPGVSICDPECTAKTYPHFFEDFSRLG